MVGDDDEHVAFVIGALELLRKAASIGSPRLVDQMRIARAILELESIEHELAKLDGHGVRRG